MMSPDSESPSASQPTGDGTRVAVRGPIVSTVGTSGQAMAMRHPERIAIWRLTGPFERQDSDGVRDDVPSAPAAPVWFFTTDGSLPDSSYRDAVAGSRSSRVYHVGAFPGDQRSLIEAVTAGQAGETGIPKHGAGDRVFAHFNSQSGRWEIMGPAEDLWRFELKTALFPGPDRNVPGTAAAYLVVYDWAGGRYVRTNLEFQVADFLGVWDASPGCRGYAKRMADSSNSEGWEVVMMETEFVSSSESSSSSA